MLPASDREVVLRYLDDLPAHEVAAALNCSVQTLEMDGRSWVFWLIGPASAPPPHYAGMLAAPLATGITGQVVLHVRLPLAQGVVVSALDTTLRYRAGGGSWLPAAGDTALLPAAATDLEVRPRGGNTGADPAALRIRLGA